jgi:thiol-disulfide isomerase/thioredoxin
VSAGAELKVEVYVKPDCSLCVPLMRTVEKVQSELGFSVEKVDISKDPELLEAYGHEIPVVFINGKKAFKYRVSEQELRKKLKRAHRAPRPRADASPIADASPFLEEEPFIPARPVILALVGVTLAVFLYFVALGVSDAHQGRGRLAAKLLRVDPRNDQPVRFSLEALGGGKTSLDDYKNKVVFLNFWATWCPPCIEEMPSMVRLHERMKDDDRFVMLAVSADEGWDPVKKFFANRAQPKFKVLLDPSGQIAKQYGTTMFPETYVVVNGKIIGFIEGPRDWDRWFADEYLRSLVSARPSTGG